MDPGHQSACHVAGLDSFEAPVAHGREEQEDLLADHYTIVMEDHV